MSVLIKGMKMPRKGEYLMTLYVDSDGSAYIDVESFPEDKDKFDAIEVPQHGRLIDADAYHKEIRERYQSAKEWYNEAEDDEIIGRAEATMITFTECSLTLRKMPTIIESEGT